MRKSACEAWQLRVPNGLGCVLHFSWRIAPINLSEILKWTYCIANTMIWNRFDLREVTYKSRNIHGFVIFASMFPTFLRSWNMVSIAKWKNAVSLAPTQWRYCIFALCFVFPDFPRASIPTCLPGRPCKSPQNSRSLGNETFIPCQDVPCLSCTLSTDVPTGYTEVMANMETASCPWEMRL